MPCFLVILYGMDKKICMQCAKPYERGEQNKAWFSRSKFCSHACHYASQHTTAEDVLARTEVDPFTGCMIWVGGYRRPDGYGEINIREGKFLVHRFLWERLNGPIPKGMQLDHICRERACCNVYHLRVVTNRENTLAPGSMSFGAVNARKKVCPKCGGPYSLEKDGSRRCRPCQRERAKLNQRRYRAEKCRLKENI